MRIFVNNVDGYLAGAVCADLTKLSWNIIGTRKSHIDELVPPYPVVQQVVPRLEVRQLLKTIASSDVVVYDLHDADLEELETVLRILYESEINQELVFILISSVGVWARTPREYEEVQEAVPERVPTPQQDEAGQEGASPEAGGEATPNEQKDGAGESEEAAAEAAEVAKPARPRLRPLKSEDYIRRRPAPKFQEWRTIETLTLALKGRGGIRPYVVCAGLPYGNGEEAFFGLFRAAWMTRPTLRVIGDGHNSLPLVHIRDAARLVRHILEERPALDYHLAVDRGDATQREIIEAVANEFGIPYEIKSVSIPEALLAEMADILTMDLRLEPSSLMEAVEKPASVPDAANEAASLAEEGMEACSASVLSERPVGFRWWCEAGLPANMSTVSAEFRRWRCLHPVRFCVVGPPGSAMTLIGRSIARTYNLPHLILDDLVEEARNSEGEAGKALRDKIAEVEAALANPKSSGPFFLPSALLAKVVEKVVSTKPCLYRGYVLSGFPQCLEDAVEWFFEEQPLPAGEEPVEDPKADKKGKKGEEAPKTVQVLREGRVPDGLAIVTCTEEASKARFKDGEVPEEQWFPSFKKKWERWQKDSADPTAGLNGFFSGKLSIEALAIAEPDASEQPAAPGGSDPAEAEPGPQRRAETAEEFVERAAWELSRRVEVKKQVNNFMLPPVEPRRPEAPVDQGSSEVVDAAARRREEEELKRKKEQEDRLEQVKKDELVKLEKHSEPLRQYLMNFVVPTVSSGLVEVCRVQPDDPVGYLAEYLSAYSRLSRRRTRGKLGSVTEGPDGASVS